MKKQKFLIGGLIVLLLAIILQTLVFSEANTELFISHLREQLAQETNLAEDQIFRVKQKLKKKENVDFDLFLEDLKYPTFIYRNGKLIFWSNHTIYLDYHYDISGYYDERCFRSSADKSIYLAKKSFLTLKNQDYEVVVLLPLFARYQNTSSFLSFTLNPNIFLQSKGVNISLPKVGVPIENQYEVYLFSVLFTGEFTYYSSHRWVVLAVALLGLVLLGIQLSIYLRVLLDHGKEGRATILLIAVLALVRAIMLYYNIPYSYIPYELFDAKTFASSSLSPSLGDLLLNVLSIAIVGAFVFTNYPRIIRYRKMLPLNELGKSVMATSWVLASYITLYSCHSVLDTMLSNSIYSSSGVFVDISKRVDFSTSNIVSLLVFILVSIIYFAVSHITSKLLAKLGDSVYDAPTRFVAGSLIFYICSLSLQVENLFLFNLNALYIISITFFNLPFFIQKSDYSAYIYLFTWALVSAAVGSYSIVTFYEVKDLERKSKYATKLILENDQIAEFYLNSLVNRVKEDSRVPILLEQGKVKPILSKIRRTYMKQYLDKYQVKIHIYNNKQELLWGRAEYGAKVKDYQKYDYQTEYDEIFFVNEVTTGNKEYVVFIDITHRGVNAGHIVLNLKQRRVTPNSIQQNFFIKQHYYDDFLPKEYSYAIYKESRLIYSSGAYAYDDPFLKNFKHPDGFWMSELELGGYKHILRPNDKGQQIIVTSPEYPLNDAFTNFSFFFLLLIFTLLVGLTVYNLLPKKNNRYLNFNTKVQLYLNFAFFLPLIIVSLIIVSILNNANQEDVQGRYLEKAQNIANELRTSVEEYHTRHLKNDTLELEQLEDRIARISNTTQADIDLFDDDGEIMMSSQRYIYENKLIAGRLNPNAYSQLIEQHQNKALLKEDLGVRQFSAAYVGIRSSVNNDIIAIIGIPFFGPKSQDQIIDVLSRIMQVFAIILILLLGLSYVSALSLTAPLRLIRHELRKVSFQGQNKPIDYQSDDEIGLLVNEYNKMLLKLEESRQALSRSEKESAWREMAKQVAHEIKNPLTPMKLNLQQLQRVLDGEQPIAKRSIKMLISQIDTLSDIATSFSAFARMPLPKEEPVDLCLIINQVVNLHSNRSEANIELDQQAQTLLVLGDERLLSRIFTNLIINGIQAVPEGRVPHIRVTATLKKEQKRALLQFTDNGSGIPAETRDKVFMPNFTTKSSGSGIGLAIAKRGIEQLKGRVWFETELDKGTSFFIEIPIRPEDG